MVESNVSEDVGYGFRKALSFSFGTRIERIAMLWSSIPDVRLRYGSDVPILSLNSRSR